MAPSETPTDPNAELPAWMAPPLNEIGGGLVLDAPLAINDAAAIFLTRISAHSVGFSFDCEMVTRELQEVDPLHARFEFRGGGSPSPEMVQLEIEYADGRRGSLETTPHLVSRPPDAETTLRVTTQGGGGWGTQHHQSYWVWPLPPVGPVRFLCRWPSLSIDEAVTELDSMHILEASNRALRLWA